MQTVNICSSQERDSLRMTAFEGNLYRQLGLEFDRPPAVLKAFCFGMIHGNRPDQQPDEELIDYCRRKFAELGGKSRLQKIRFIRDTDVVMTGHDPMDWESVNFDKYDERLAVVLPAPAPDTDMSDVSFADGRRCRIMTENFEIVGAAEA